MKGVGVLETDLLANDGDRGIGFRQQLNRRVPAEFILDRLEGGALRGQPAGQRAQGQVQRAGGLTGANREAEAWAQVLADLLPGRVLLEGDEQLVAGGPGQEPGERAPVLADRRGQLGGLEVEG